MDPLTLSALFQHEETSLLLQSILGPSAACLQHDTL